jgi:HlyD family secretion protein
MMGMGGAGQFSEKDLANADLPAAPESDNNLDVLIRPGLLSDVEIILEKIPNAINIPAQGVFEKEGRQIVWIKKGNSWEERPIKPLKRTESTMIIASGLKPGELIALSDPFSKPGDKKKDKSGSSSGGPIGGMPAGGGR